MPIYGVQYCTDSRDDQTIVKAFRSETQAKEWRDEIGGGGTGRSFSAENGHRYLRKIYRLDRRLPSTANGWWIMRHGDLIP